MVTIDVSSVSTERELHDLLKQELGFPNFCGRNWSAFWDAITGLVRVPDHLRFTGWSELLDQVPEGGRELQLQLDRYRDEYRPGLLVEYS
ncbi:barstar family protein [Streptomyces sp. NPDC087440]|uniref:barstar family protein n=1 Tax=Streptomyces sp. NPDC087440 TaxID=3365790 RepID=UPI00382C50A8